MEEEEFNKIIAKLENENPKEKAFFGIHDIGVDGDEAYIKANKFGLELFACELIKASRKANEAIEDSEKIIIPFDRKEKWFSGDIWIDYIELNPEHRTDLKEKTNQRSWKDKAFEFGCFLTIIIVVIIFIVGITSVISWIKV